MDLLAYCLGKEFYLMGIGGVSMSALAKLLLIKGARVHGYDRRKSEYTNDLSALGVKIAVGEDWDEEILQKSSIFVYSDAISQEDRRMQFAKANGKTLLSRGRFLGLISSGFQKSIAVGGSHGKTTTTSMIAHALFCLHLPFCAHIGGEDGDFGNFYYAGEEFFVTEACEYKKNLLHLAPNRSILLNADLDHMECYDGEDDLVNTFSTFCEKGEVAFVNADDERSMRFGGKFTTFGICNRSADYVAEKLKSEREEYAFSIREYGKTIAEVKLNVAGRYNVYNALASFSALRSFGFGESAIVEGIQAFKGVKRRFERIGTVLGIPAICDYAHHPKEIASTLQTAKKICKGRLFVVFQPHTYSRTKRFMEEFVSVLSPLRNLMVYKTYPAREFYDREGSGKTLSNQIGCVYGESIKELKLWISRNAKAGDTLLFLGAGDIYNVAKYIAKK